MKTLLPKLMVKITGKARYLPVIKWSDKSLVHNFFRLYELIFWRRVGIRAEMTTVYDNGKLYRYFHSVESVFAHVETLIREAFKLRFRFPYHLVVFRYTIPVGFGIIESPYLFAIAHDADVPDVTNGFSGTSTRTWTHTNTGSDLLLVGVYSIWQDVAGTGTITANTYNSVTLVKTDGLAQASMRSEQWYLKAPASGGNTFSVTLTGNHDAKKYASSSYTGCDQSSPADAHNTATGSSGDPTVSVTTGVSDALVVANLSRFSTTAATSDRTSIFNSATGSILGAGAYEITSGAAGSKSNTYTGSAAQDWSMTIASYKPVTASASNSAFLGFLMP